MRQKYPKICPGCYRCKLCNLSDHLTKVHGMVNEQDTKYWLFKAVYSTISSHAEQPYPPVLQSKFTLVQYGYTAPRTSSEPENYQTQYHPTPHQMKMKTCPSDSRISYERVWDSNVPVMDYDIFKLYHLSLVC